PSFPVLATGVLLPSGPAADDVVVSRLVADTSTSTTLFPSVVLVTCAVGGADSSTAEAADVVGAYGPCGTSACAICSRKVSSRSIGPGGPIPATERMPPFSTPPYRLW